MRRRIGVWTAVLCAVLVFLPALSPASADAQTFYVNSTADNDATASDCLQVTITTVASNSGTPDGTTCTLRGAIEEAQASEQASPGTPNTIEFSVCGPFEVTSDLPTIPEDTFVNGGAALSDPSDPNTGVCTDTFNQWFTDGSGGYETLGYAGDNYGYAHIQGPGDEAANGAFDGLTFAGSGSTMSAVVIGGFEDAVVLAAPGGDTISGNAIGNDAYEGGPLNPQTTEDGIYVDSSSANDVIGYSLAADGTDAGAGYDQDDIYGNLGWGIYLAQGSGPTTIGHNFIGTDTSGDPYACDGPLPVGFSGCPSFGTTGDPTGTPILDGNGHGGVYDDGTGDTIGGSSTCETYYNVCSGNAISGNQGPGVEFGPDAVHDTVSSNDIGDSLNFYQSPAAEAAALPNLRAGVEDQGTDDVIGGPTAGDSNTISGNAGPGVLLEGSSAAVQNNLIGLSFDGTGATPNQGAGIRATDEAGVTSGSNRITANTIGGNTGPGVELDQAGNAIAGNFIGVAGDHATALPNSAGIVAARGPQVIGGPTANPNLITDNSGPGVEVVDPGPGTEVTGVNIEDNEIYANAGLGIDLGDDGVTANHMPDSAMGPNGFTNFPVLTSASAVGGQWSVHGTLDAQPSTYYNIYLYGDAQCDPSGYGQGQTLVSGGSATTDASGHVAFALSGSGGLPPVLSAYAVGGTGSSEFSQCISVSGGAALSSSQTVSGGGTVISGEPVDIDIHIANGGPEAATNTILNLSVPTGEAISSPPAGCPSANGASLSCNVGSIASGASVDVHVILTPSSGVQTLTDVVTTTSDQVQLTDGSSTLTSAVTPNPNQPSTVSGGIGQPAPTFGQYLRVDREAGTVTATLPNGQSIDLQNYALIPDGTIISATAGQALITATQQNGATTTSLFKYGQFKISQDPNTGLVDAKMDGSLAGCSASQLSIANGQGAQGAARIRRSTEIRRGPFTPGSDLLRGALKLATKPKPTKPKPTKPKAKAKPKMRRLWGHDTGGNYTITGDRGAATVQGTIWEVVDTCTTTTVVVYKDSVQVVGFGHTLPHTATVTAGHSVVLRAS